MPEANKDHNRTEENKKCEVPKVINTRSNGLSNAADVVGCKVRATLPQHLFHCRSSCCISLVKITSLYVFV